MLRSDRVGPRRGPYRPVVRRVDLTRSVSTPWRCSFGRTRFARRSVTRDGNARGRPARSARRFRSGSQASPSLTPQVPVRAARAATRPFSRVRRDVAYTPRRRSAASTGANAPETKAARSAGDVHASAPSQSAASTGASSVRIGGQRVGVAFDPISKRGESMPLVRIGELGCHEGREGRYEHAAARTAEREPGAHRLVGVGGELANHRRGGRVGAARVHAHGDAGEVGADLGRRPIDRVRVAARRAPGPVTVMSQSGDELARRRRRRDARSGRREAVVGDAGRDPRAAPGVDVGARRDVG